MKKLKIILVVSCFFLFGSFITSAAAKPAEIIGLLLTWVDDPSTTMVIDMHTPGSSLNQPEITYRLSGKTDWETHKAVSFPFPYAERTIHRVKLKGLKPAHTYEFCLGKDGEIFRFRTMPKNLKRTSVRFITGGDTMHGKALMDQTNKVALTYNPDFLVLGGDFAYANGLPENSGRWVQWFQSLKENLIDKNNRVIPIVAGIGNHEVQKSTFKNHPDFKDTDEWRKKIAPYFYTFFSFPGLQGYNVLDFRKYLSFIALDTDHTNFIAGKQSEWLESTLASRSSKTRHIFPFYHVPAYPSHRAFSGANSALVRENFVPRFENHGIKVVFENHDHTFKRTYPLFQGKKVEDGKGIVYIGDGAWGVGTRPLNKEWYLARSESIRHFIVVTLKGKNADFVMVDDAGKEFDRYNY